MGKDMLRIGDELWMYYTGYNVEHHTMENPPLGTGAFGAIRMRLDGFASQDAPPTGGPHVPGGVLTTIPLLFSGNRLELNLNAGAGGWLQVEILGENEQPLPEFSTKEAELLRGNDVRQIVTWRGKADVTSLKGKAVQLRFVGRDVKLYAFQFREW